MPWSVQRAAPHIDFVSWKKTRLRRTETKQNGGSICHAVLRMAVRYFNFETETSDFSQNRANKRPLCEVQFWARLVSGQGRASL